VPKEGIPGPVRVAFEGVSGDRQRDFRYHGGPDRAVCLLSVERIDELQREGHPIAPGTTGENLTVAGLDWPRVRSGTRLRVGALLLEITGAANPCKNIAASFRDGDFSVLSGKLHPGGARMYARVLEEGEIKVGDPIIVDPALP